MTFLCNRYEMTNNHLLQEMTIRRFGTQGLSLMLMRFCRLSLFFQVFHSLPYFDWAFIDPIKDSGNEFKSDSHIMYITCPVLILHAQDDVVVPVELGRKVSNFLLNV